MRKLILKNGFSPGDLIMMTAAVRDLHLAYPGQFLTDVRSACPEIWENNPHLTRIENQDPEAEVIPCEYPLINQCNTTPYHCLHGYVDFFNHHLGLNIKPSRFHGDIHLSPREKSWHSQVYELAGQDLPFWIVAAGGKYDISIKWWSQERYQQVVDHFRGKIQFVQIGAEGHHHPRLQGVIDLRGQTSLRELIRLVYHAQGVLCPVTALMHLAAAVETKPGAPPNRPCVVVAGGREPAHWEAYPDHQFIHTNGTLPCNSAGPCWKDRVIPLGDGDKRDHPENLCDHVTGDLPRCMDMISAAEVIRRISLYFEGGVLPYLTAPERTAGRRAQQRSRSNPCDLQPLHLHNARLECNRFIARLPQYPNRYRGRGIVICAGGPRYFPCAWVAINMLRKHGCTLPIEVWHLGRREMNPVRRRLLNSLGARTVDALARRRKHPCRLLAGWPLKAYATVHSRFQEILFLDADNVPLRDPSYLFSSPEYRKFGAMFWPDFGREPRADPIWKSCGVERPPGPEFESGQFLVDKRRCWDALNLALWFNENADFYYRYLHGDKETFHLAFRRLSTGFHLIKHPPRALEGTICQHDPPGQRLFQHRNTLKWSLKKPNKSVAGFEQEETCLGFLESLRNNS